MRNKIARVFRTRRVERIIYSNFAIKWPARDFADTLYRSGTPSPEKPSRYKPLERDAFVTDPRTSRALFARPGIMVTSFVHKSHLGSAARRTETAVRDAFGWRQYPFRGAHGRTFVRTCSLYAVNRIRSKLDGSAAKARPIGFAIADPEATWSRFRVPPDGITFYRNSPTAFRQFRSK